MIELKKGMRVLLNGKVSGRVEDVGYPEDLPNWKGWTGGPYGEALVDMLRKFEVSCCAFVAVDGTDGSTFLCEQRGKWRLTDGVFVEVEVIQ